MLQSVIRAIYPPQCLACGEETEAELGLCARCWRETRFIHGTRCNACGVPLPGDAAEGEVLACDDCMKIARPWEQGRAVLAYEGTGRRIVLGLKHGDRTDMAPALARWMQRAAPDLTAASDVIVPIPIHWSRLLRRRYNQAAVLAQGLARLSGRSCLPDALIRTRRTPMLDGKTRDARFETLDGAIVAASDAGLAGRSVLLVDDVMTSGATLAAAADACHAAGATRVSVLVLARVAKAP